MAPVAKAPVARADREAHRASVAAVRADLAVMDPVAPVGREANGAVFLTVGRADQAAMAPAALADREAHRASVAADRADLVATDPADLVAMAAADRVAHRGSVAPADRADLDRADAVARTRNL